MADQKPSRRRTTSNTPDSYGPLPEEPENRSEATQVAVDRWLTGQPTSLDGTVQGGDRS